MRRTDEQMLEQPYSVEGGAGDHRFYSAIGADVPHADELAREILSDLNTNTFGLPTLNSLPDQERILISDYLYQCVSSIEANLVEAKIHLLEFLDASDKQSKWISDMISTEMGRPIPKMPKVTRPMDDLPNVLEKLHICGFFRAIGSGLDCLGGVIVAIAGLPIPLRPADINSARKSLSSLVDDSTQGRKLQMDFHVFLDDVLSRVGPPDWLSWSTQYRNMFVHRGRRIMISHVEASPVRLYGGDGRVIPRSQQAPHLAKYPDKTDIEAMLHGSTTVLDESAEETLEGIFQSTREFLEIICEKLQEMWQQRKQNPSLIQQPISQWNKVSKQCEFDGYDQNAPKLKMDTMISNPIVLHRFHAASAMDHQRQLWANSIWTQ